MTNRVLVVGGGIAGLATSRGLAQRGIGVTLLEARERVGGRLLSVPLRQGLRVDLGGQWITAGQDRVRALADELGIERIPVDTSGVGVFRSRSEEGARFDAGSFRAVAETVRKLEEMAREVPLEAPWTAARAADWDATTLEAWLESEQPDEGARLYLRRLSEGHHCGTPRQVSLLHALFYARSNPGSYAAGDGDPAVPESLAGGAQSLCIRMSEALGSRVLLGSPVRWIRRDVHGVRVGGPGFELTAARVVIAMPPALTRLIDFEPALPPERRNLAARAAMGGGYKVQALYPEPFWRRAGLSGFGMLDTGMVVSSSVLADGDWGLLSVLLGPEQSSRLAALDPGDRRRAVLEDLALLFGPAARCPDDYLEHSWCEEEYSRGDVGLLEPGALVACGAALRGPVGRIHWAGTETATEFYTHMEGAIRSAERVVREVVEDGS